MTLAAAYDVVKAYSAGASLRRRASAPPALNGVSLEVRQGETVGLVGESGSGKSTLARCMLRLTDLTYGDVQFRDRSLLGLRKRELRELRQQMQIVFQDPSSSLDPRMTVGKLVEEPLVVHGLGDRRERRDRAVTMLGTVGLNDVGDRFPHQFSGGQRQRVAIARALVLKPEFVVLDEPVTALDVSVQAQVLNLLRELQETLGLTYLFIVHDLLVAEYFCDRVAVMYDGRIVESGPREAIFNEPHHPYTAVLLAAVPQPTPGRDLATERKVVQGAGQPATEGCPFRPRCPIGREREVCADVGPPLTEASAGHWSACHFPEEAAALAPSSTRLPSSTAPRRGSTAGPGEVSGRDAALKLVRGVRPPTPLEAAPTLDRHRELLLKREDLGPTNTFKWRGALCACDSLRQQGHESVVTASTGNHGLATAWAASRLGMTAHVVLPHRSNPAKRQLAVDAGARVHEHGDSVIESTAHAAELAARMRAPLFEDGASDAQMLGTGTVGRELVDARCDTVVVPVACGALAGGLARELAASRSRVHVVGVQSTAFARLTSERAGADYAAPPHATTIADGLADDRIVEPAFSACQVYVDDMLAVDDDALERAVRELFEHCGIVVEPAAAAPLAALRTFGERIPGKRIALVVSGANIDPALRNRLLGRDDA